MAQNQQPCGQHHWGTHDNPTTSKIAYDDIEKAFLVEEWKSFCLSWKEQDYLHFKDFLKYKCVLYLKKP